MWEKIQGEIFVGVITAVVIALCYLATLWRTPKITSRDKKPVISRIEDIPIEASLEDIQCDLPTPSRTPKITPRDKKPVIFRIENIPIEASHEGVKHDLESFIKKDSDFVTDAASVIQLRLVPRDERIAFATATLDTSISAEKVVEKLRNAKFKVPYHFDVKFGGITPLYEPEGGADVDVIAVPGLGSHPMGTWRSPDGKDVWLRDFLPYDVPKIRMLLYGYDTSLLGSTSKDSIGDLGRRFLQSIKAFRTKNKRPIIFIGHSLGGLLIKEALTQAKKKNEDVKNVAICKACYGLLLFGVPNLGLRHEQLMTIVKGQPNASLIRDLITDTDSEPSGYLKRTSEQFTELCNGQYRVISFFERKLSPTVEVQPDGSLARTGPGILMVTEKSATSTGLTAVAHEVNFSFNLNHSGLVKFSRKHQEEYSIVKAELEVLVANARCDVSRRFANEKCLTREEQRSWSSLNVPPYNSFRGSSKLAKPEVGTLEWLVKENAADEQYNTYGARYKEELRMKDFAKWRDSNNTECLLVTALPGKGKSVLSNFVLRHLESRTSQELLVVPKIIYYFCNIRNEEASPNANSILRALIVQLCEHQRSLFRLLPIEYERDCHQFFSASFDTLWDIFARMLQDNAYSHICCVIDGLDVYQEGMTELVSKLSQTFNCKDIKNGTLIRKLFCTSRPERDILTTWRGAPSKVLRCNLRDLDIFIESKVISLGEGFTHEMKTIIKDECRKQADRTFLWLDVVIRSIQSMCLPTEDDLRKTIQEFPQELDEVYSSLIEGLVRKNKKAARLLAWVVYARNPLDFRQLEEAISIDIGPKSTTYEDCTKNKPLIASDVIHRDFGTLLDAIDGRVYLIHQSLKDYFERRDPLKACTNIASRLIPAHTCMAYLSLEDFGKSKLDKGLLLSKYPLWYYAARYWDSHIGTAADIRQNSALRYFLKQIVDSCSYKTLNWRTLEEVFPDWRSLDSIAYFQTFSPIQSREDFGPVSKVRTMEVAMLYDIGWLAELLCDKTICELENDVWNNDVKTAAEKRQDEVTKCLINGGMRNNFEFLPQTIQAIARNCKGDAMALVFDSRRADIPITEEVLKAAASNYGSAKEVMAVILDQKDRRGEDIPITEEVLKVVAGNVFSKGILALLLDRPGANMLITEEVVKIAAANGRLIITLLDRLGPNLLITEEVLQTAAANDEREDILKALLDELDQRGACVLDAITEGVIQAAAQFRGTDKGLIVLLERSGLDAKVTGSVVKMAVHRGINTEGILTLLEDRWGRERVFDFLIELAKVYHHSGSYLPGKFVHVGVRKRICFRREPDGTISKRLV